MKCRLVVELTRRLQNGDRDPIAGARMIIEVSTATFVADSVAFRQAIGSVRVFPGTGATMEVDPSRLHIAAVKQARNQVLIRRDLDASALGKQIYLGYVGAAFAWAEGGLDDDGCLIAALHGQIALFSHGQLDQHGQLLAGRARAQTVERSVSDGWEQWDRGPEASETDVPRPGREVRRRSRDSRMSSRKIWWAVQDLNL